MKIVLDSSVLLVALGRKSRFKPIWDAFVDGKYQLILSDEIFYEYQEILHQHSAKGVAESVTDILLNRPIFYFNSSIIIGMSLKKIRMMISFSI